MRDTHLGKRPREQYEDTQRSKSERMKTGHSARLSHTRFRPLTDVQTSSSTPQDQSDQGKYNVKELTRRMKLIYQDFRSNDLAGRARKEMFLAKKMYRYLLIMDRSYLESPQTKDIEQVMQDIQNVAYNDIHELTDSTISNIKININKVIKHYTGLNPEQWD